MTVTVNESLTPAQAEVMPRRACCQLGQPLDVRPDRPSFSHAHPARPCLSPIAAQAQAAPRRATEDDRTDTRPAEGKESL